MRKESELRAAGTGRRAALYIRVSSEEQAKHGLSLEAQREKLRQYAASNGLRIIEEYPDEGYSARKSFRSRPQFLRLLDDVEREKFDVILFIKLDRWFRNVSDYYEIQRILDDHHVSWIATEEEYDTTTANGRLHLNIKLSIAQDEADRTSEHIKFVFESKLRRGEVVSGKVPFGYKIENKRLAVDDEKAPIVRDIFDHYLSLLSIGALREYTVEAGRPDTITEEKLRTLTRRIYGGRDINIMPKAAKELERLTALGCGGLPVCVAKTQYSFSDDPAKLGAPEDFTVTVKSVKLSAGAGFVVALTGDIMTMPGLPKRPAAERIDVDGNGKISGLF